MLFRNRNQERRMRVGLSLTLNDLAATSDVIHEQTAEQQALNKRITAQKREEERVKREKRRNRAFFSTPFNDDEYAEQEDLMRYLRQFE